MPVSKNKLQFADPVATFDIVEMRVIVLHNGEITYVPVGLSKSEVEELIKQLQDILNDFGRVVQAG